MAQSFRDRIICGACPVRIDAAHRCCWLADGRRFRYESLISTAPLPRLLDLLADRASPPELFRSSAVANIRIGVRGRLRVACHWLYLPDDGVPIYRVGFPSNVNPRTAPPGHFGLSLEYGLTAAGDRRLAANEVAEASVARLSRAGWIDVDEVLFLEEKLISPAYVVCRSEGRPAFTAVRQRLRSAGIHLAGRFGRWDYYSMEDAFQSGLEAARDVEPAAQAATRDG